MMGTLSSARGRVLLGLFNMVRVGKGKFLRKYGWILLLAFVLRAPLLTWGLPVAHSPFQPYHPDEPKIVFGALDVPTFLIENTDFRYPTLFHQILGWLTLPVHRAPWPLATRYRIVALVGRALVLLMALGTVYLSAFLADRWFGEPHGLLAALWLSLSLYHAESSVWTTTDVPLAFLALVFVWWAWRITVGDGAPGTSRDFKWGGFLFGLVVGMKYPGALFLSTMFVFYAASRGQKRSSWRSGLRDGRVWAFVGTSVCTFLLTTPGILWHPKAFLSSVFFESQRLRQIYLPPWHPGTWLHLEQKLATAVGWPMALSLSVALFPWPSSWTTRALAMPIWLTLLLFGDALLPRYYIPLLPLWGILAAYRWLHFGRSARWKKWILGWLVVVSLYSLGYAACGIPSRLRDTRPQAARYLETHFPAGTRIGIGYTSQKFGWKLHRWRYPPIDFQKFQAEDFLHSPEVVVLSSYDVYPILEALHSPYLLSGYRWAPSYKGVWYRGEPPSPEIFRFFEAVFVTHQSDYCLEAFFPSHVWVPIEFPPPAIWILVRKEASRSSCVPVP